MCHYIFHVVTICTRPEAHEGMPLSLANVNDAISLHIGAIVPSVVVFRALLMQKPL
jgi:hypothetical protein